MLTMKALYHSEQVTSDFEIDIAQKNGCKGVFKIEVHIHPLSAPLIIKDGTDQLITANKPFVIESTQPIINGLLKFEFREYKELQSNLIEPFNKAIVRYLYCE